MAQNSTTVAASVTFDYDALARRIATQQPHHSAPSTISYIPSSNQIASQTDAAGNTTTFTYYDSLEHGAGQIKSIEDALEQMSYRAYDALGRPTKTWGETDYPQAYSYNAYGELETLTTWRDTGINFSTAGRQKGSATVIESSANCIFFDFIQLLFQLTVHVDYEFTHCGDDSAFEWLSSGD
jgi:YD repeat-containing protein